MHITEDKAKNLFYQIMKALEYTHSKGIFHRDIKPEVTSKIYVRISL
jgi:serine/threonine protein kinase